MKNLQIIGHLGDDSKVLVTTEKKPKFHTVQFSVAHTEKFEDKEGKEVERTIWVSCFKRYKNDPKKVLDVLKKGLKVYVDGSPNFRIQTSQSGGAFVGITINVNNMEFMSKKEAE